MKVVFHLEVLEEMLESARYYDECSLGLGWDFLDAVEQTNRRIVAFPQAGPILRREVRKRLCIWVSPRLSWIESLWHPTSDRGFTFFMDDAH